MIPTWSRGLTQTFQGVDRTRGLVVPNSPNWLLNLEVITAVSPESTYTKAAFRAREIATVNALVARSEAVAPVVWIEDSTKSKTVGSITGTTVTTTGHGFSTGDRVLIRRTGLGLYSVCTVGTTTSNTFVVSGATHTIQAGDDIHLIEEYHGEMAYTGSDAIQSPGDYYTESWSHKFMGPGSTYYTRTTVTL